MKKSVAFIIIIFLSQVVFADVTIQTDTMKLVINEYSGNVCVYSKNSKDKFVPVLDSKQFANMPSFYVNIDGLVYPVNTINGFDISAVTNADGSEATFNATLDAVVKISIKYSFFSTVKGGKVNAVRMAPSVVSLSKNKIEVGLKAVFDTYLGESTDIHFSSKSHSSIVAEQMDINFTQGSWFQSKNNENSLTFIVPNSQKDILESVVIAGKDRLYNTIWNYNYKKDRTFNSLNLYNNSAISFMWDVVTVGSNPNNVFELFFYIGLEDYSTSALLNEDFNDLYINSRLTETAESKTDIIETIIRTVKAAQNGTIVLTQEQIESLLVEADTIIYDAKGAVLEAQSTEDELHLMQSLIDIIHKLEKEENQATYEEVVALNLLIDQMLEKAAW